MNNLIQLVRYYLFTTLNSIISASTRVTNRTEILFLYFHLQFAKTLVCQGHLCPTPLHVTPVYWAYDHALRLYPLPDLLVCADKYDPFSSTQADCTVINPVSGYIFCKVETTSRPVKFDFTNVAVYFIYFMYYSMYYSYF